MECKNCQYCKEAIWPKNTSNKRINWVCKNPESSKTDIYENIEQCTPRWCPLLQK